MTSLREPPSSDTSDSSEKDSDYKYRSAGYRRYVLVMLTAVYAFNYIDRQLLSILQESIKLDLGLSDTQLGLLTGLAFAVFFVTAGIPIARWADRANRRNIIALAVAVWSFMTVISGACQTYWQMLLARIGVGVGEAGAAPPSHSMISDMYLPESRATAMSIFSMSVNIGIMFGFLLGGFLNEVLGWRWAFVIAGAPGILLAVIVRLTIKEPIRGYSEKTPVNQDSVPIGGVIRRITGSPVLRHLFIGAGLNGLSGYGLVTWTAPFFIRSHDMGTAELGIWLAISAGVFGALGTFLSGYLADRLGLRDRRWYLWLGAGGMLLVAPVSILILTTQNLTLALVVNLLPNMLLAAYLGPGVAVMHGSVDLRMRATASALFYFVVNMVGLGLGPTLIGAISDVLTPTFGQESLRWAMLFVVPIGAIWASVHFFIGAHHLRNEKADFSS